MLCWEKNVWQTIKGESKTWVSLIKGKYGVNDNMLSMNTACGSVVWQSIQKTRDVIKGGFSFKLGNGKSSFWFTEWLGNFKICDKVLAVDIHDIQTTVRDVIIDGQ